MNNEWIDYGQEVFNCNHTKFLRWFQKTNLFFGGEVQEILLETNNRSDEVIHALDQIA
jgi:hypothetical protein